MLILHAALAYSQVGKQPVYMCFLKLTVFECRAGAEGALHDMLQS